MGCSGSTPQWRTTPARQTIFVNACPEGMEEWVIQWDSRNPMMGGGSNVGIHPYPQTDMPTFCLRASGARWNMFTVATDGKPDKENTLFINPGWKLASKITTGNSDSTFACSGEMVTKVQQKASRSISIEGFGKTIGIMKYADANDDNCPGLIMQGMEFSAPSQAECGGRPTMRFTSKGCLWLASAEEGTVVAEVVLAALPAAAARMLEQMANTTGETEITMDPTEYMNMLSAPLGLRLQTSLSSEDKQLLMAACATSAPFLLRGCEMTLDSLQQRRDIG